MGYSNVDEDKFMYKYRWEVRASYDYDSSLFKKMQKAEDLIIKSNKLLKDSPIGEISYTEQADDIKKYKKQLNTIYDFIEEAYTKVISGIDEPLYEAFKNGPTSILGNLKAEDFETDNTLGLTQNESNGFRAGIYQKEKKNLTLEDFLTGNLNGDIEYYSMFGKLYREDCKNYGAFDRDASSYVGQYYSDAQLNYTGCVDEILTAGEYYHKKDNPWYVEYLKAEAWLIEPIYKAITGKEIFSGEKISDSEQNQNYYEMLMLYPGLILGGAGAIFEESCLIGGVEMEAKTLTQKEMESALAKAMENSDDVFVRGKYSAFGEMTAEDGISYRDWNYERIKEISIHNPESDSMTLGKFRPSINIDGTENWKIAGPDSYNVIAENNGDMYFDMKNGLYDDVMGNYNLSYQNMFDEFNVPALDEAISENKVIRFSHNPELSEYAGSFTDQEWKYLQNNGDYLYLREDGGFWYAEK